MANTNNEGADYNPDSSKDEGLDKSFVGKFVSGLLQNTPLSKWFGKEQGVRRRDEDEEEDPFSLQPPVKRAKRPQEHNNYSAHVFESPVIVHSASTANNVSRVAARFPEPVAGPSGLKSRKLFAKHDVVNGERDSDSEESTSGYGSAPRLDLDKSKLTGCEKSPPKSRSLFTATTEPSPSRSLFADRSPPTNTSLSSRRPTFNASTFGSPNFVDRTLSTKRILNSPFYNGRTIYGGASAYGRRLGQASVEPNNRASVQIKPVNEKKTTDNTALSKTARRILSTLEQYSTPISDAKKIPVTPRKSGILTKYIGATPYLARERKRPTNTELQVPSVPELLQMKQKTRLQTSTESVRQIATSSKSDLNKDEYKLRTEDEKVKHSNKMKSSVTSVRQKPIQPVGEVKLPKVSLPITTLPKFDFVMMQNSTATASNKDEKTVRSDFTFSSPLVISEELKTIAAINCFKFSEPLCKKQCLDVGTKSCSGASSHSSSGASSHSSSGASSDSGAKSPSAGFRMRNNGENVSGGATGKKDTWECDTCLVKNDADRIKCAACDEPKPQGRDSGFGDSFKLSSDKWECGSCLVRNNNSDSKCVACTSAKPAKTGFGDLFKPPAATWECQSCLVRNKNELDKCVACGEAKSQPTGFGKFRPPSDSWECGTCMIRNKNELEKCQACEASKPGLKQNVGSFGDKFKPPPETWECPTCMIRNKKEVSRCPACETLKPGSKPPSASFCFGIKPPDWECKTCLIKNKDDLSKCAACGTTKDKSPEKKGFGDVFKPKSGEWECPSCMVRNKQVEACVCCGVSKPGATNEKLSEITKGDKTPVISFNFGIDKSGPVQSTTKSEVKESTASTTAPTFSFGIPKPASTTTTFTFGVNTQEKVVSTSSEAVATNPLLKPDEKLPEPSVPAPVGFKFGVDSQKEASRGGTTSTTQAPVFSAAFEPPKPTLPASEPPKPALPTPAFQFKPAAINGDLIKPKDSVFGAKPSEGANPFSSQPPAVPTFKFSPKPLESPAVPQLPTTQAAPSPGKSENVNGFAVPKAPPAFGATQGFESKPFAFGGADPAPKSASFSFGQGEKRPANQVFSFGAPSAPSAGFSFSTPPAPAAGFGFGAPAKTEGQPFGSSSGVFGNAGAAKNGSFNFGTNSNNNNQKAIFTFGASQTNSVGFGAAPNSSGFNFGAPAAPSPSGGFNFSGAPPSFNFTDGSAAAAPPQRKFKRAVRRTTHR